MINLAVNVAGDLFYNTERVSLLDAERRLSERFGTDPNTPVYISGDADTRHADMVKALDLVRRIGFNKAAFNVKANASPAK
jgi:biopolymer transport protein ExbD